MSQSSTSRALALKELARRLARPLTGPLDGRIADINRRVGDARTTIEQRTAVLEHAVALTKEALGTYADSVAAYARASGETTSFLGVELRRVDEALHAYATTAQVAVDCAQRAAEAADAAHGAAEEARATAQAALLAAQAAGEDGYRARLARAADMPLEQLDASLAALINGCTGHRGFAAQADLWFMPPILAQLGEGKAHLALVNERIVEIPFAMGALNRLPTGARVLDIGSTESTFALSAASLGYRVTAIDPRPLRYSHPSLATFHGRFEDWDPPSDERFDAVFLISTIEHIGVGAYGQSRYGGEAVGRGADRAVIARVGELLAPAGLLVLTTPIGTRGIDELERTYDEKALEALLADFEVLERRSATRADELTWISGAGPGPGERGVAMVIATPARA